MGVDTPKPLLPFQNINLIHQVISTSLQIDGNIKLSIIVGHKKERVIEYINECFPKLEVEFIFQEKQLGTGHAISEYLLQTKNNASDVMILCADTPLITINALNLLLEFQKENNLNAAGLSFIANNPYGYGRIKREKGFSGINIIEEKDACEEDKKISEVNSGIYLVKRNYLDKKIKNIDNENKSGEFYLTDIMDKAERCNFITIDNGENVFLGVNTMDQLEQTEQIARENILLGHKKNGVRFLDSSSVFIGLPEVKIGSGVTIMPNVHLRGKTSIGKNSLIEVGAIIMNSSIGESVTIFPYTVVEDSKIERSAKIGPFARIRPNSQIGESCKVGNFVETKKAELQSGAKVSHLSYVGDASIGKNTNIGCGFITCNYDGKNKHQTKIGDNCFIGSDSQMIAPVNIGNDCFVASGSTINSDLKSGDFAISRSRQVTKQGMAKKFLKK